MSGAKLECGPPVDSESGCSGGGGLLPPAGTGDGSAPGGSGMAPGGRVLTATVALAALVAAWRVDQNDSYEGWRRARHDLLTASDVSKVLGLNAHEGRGKLLKAKARPFATEDSFFVTSAMRGGQFLEDGVFAWWLDDHNRALREQGLPPAEGHRCRHPSGTSMLVLGPGRLAASPDALVWSKDAPLLVEVKVTNPKAWGQRWGEAAMQTPRAWSRYSSVEPPSYGKCPLAHWIQLQTQMLCTGVGFGYVVGDCGTARLDFGFPADAHIQEIIVRESETFWLEVDHARTSAQATPEGDELDG